MHQLRHRTLWQLHLSGCLVAFCLNFGAKGSEIWLNTYIDELHLNDSTSPTWLETHFSRVVYFGLIAGKIVGDLFNLVAGQWLGRLRSLQLSFCCAGACVLLISQTRSLWLLLALATAQGAFQDLLWCNVYVYLAEAFPTSIRSTAFGLAMGVGRSGGVASTAIGGAVSSKQLAFLLYGVAFFVGAASVCFLGKETSGRPLRDAVL